MPLWFASNLLFLHYQSQHCITLSEAAVVVICFEFIIFALSITAILPMRFNPLLLWFASNLLFLHYQSQQHDNKSSMRLCCDLLRIYYFCTINHSISRIARRSRKVVICFEFIILHYQSQPHASKKSSHASCDLLRIYYFCTINHS